MIVLTKPTNINKVLFKLAVLRVNLVRNIYTLKFFTFKIIQVDFFILTKTFINIFKKILYYNVYV